MASRMGAGGAKQRLMSELKTLQKEKWVNLEGDGESLFRWRLGLIVVNSESAFNGAYLRAEMTFTDEYPYQPPKFRFRQPIWHPNIYPDGQLCISILHTPGEDTMSGETASERWSPLQGVESVLRSILLLLDDPEINSPANVDAGVMYRDNRAEYNAQAAATVARSKNDIPAGFVMPTTTDLVPPPPKMDNDDAFWQESEEEYDFGGSDTGDEEDNMEDFEEEDGADDNSDDDE